MAKISKEMKKTETNAGIAAFLADIELEQYCHRVETGALTDEEKEERRQILKFLGY